MPDKEKEKRLILEIENQLGIYMYSLNDVTLEEAVAKILIDKKMTIAIAESCTGGSISKRLTDVSGSSKYFLGSIIEMSLSKKGFVLKSWK